MSRILLPVVFEETTKQLSFYENEKIGRIQESILYSFSLMIYNIEYTQVIWEDGSNMIMGEESMSFHETWKSCLERNQKEGISIRRIEIVDRKRDEKGNVIKENKIIDKYLQFEQNHSNQDFMQSWNIPFHNFSNPSPNITFRNFESSLFQDLLQPNILQRLSQHIQTNREHDTESISTESSEEEEEDEGEVEEREFLEIRNEYSERDGNTMNIQISGTLQSSNPLFQLLEQSFQQLSREGLTTNITIDEQQQEESKEENIEKLRNTLKYKEIKLKEKCIE